MNWPDLDILDLPEQLGRDDYNPLNIAMGPHKLTWFGCFRPSQATWQRQPSPLLVLHIALYITSVFIYLTEYHIVRIHLFLSNLTEMTFPISTIEEKWKRIWNFQMTIIHWKIALGTWQSNPLEMTPHQVLSCTLPGHKTIFWEIYVFHWVMDILKLHFSYLYNGNWYFQMTRTCTILLWDPINWPDLDVLDLPKQLGRDNPPPCWYFI